MPADRLTSSRLLAISEFFADLGRGWTQTAHDRGAEIEPPVLEATAAFELQELALETAQTRVRRFDPCPAHLPAVL